MSSADGAKGRCPLDSRPYADGTKGHCPLDFRWGLCPRPRDAPHRPLACGRDGGWAAAWANMATVFIPCAIDSFFVQNNL